MDLSNKDKGLIIKQNFIDILPTFFVQNRTISISIPICINFYPCYFFIDIYFICFKISAQRFKFLVIKLDEILQFPLEWVYFLDNYAFIPFLNIAALFILWAQLFGEGLRIIFYRVYDKRRR